MMRWIESIRTVVVVFLVAAGAASTARSQLVGTVEIGELPTAFTGSHFGAAVAATGERAVVGAPDLGGTSGGRAFAFARSGTTWSADGELGDPGLVDGDAFGTAVAIFGSTAVVGAPGHAGGGAAFVFERDASGWILQARLLPSAGTPQEGFGKSVSISGDRIVVGYPGDDPNGPNSGSATTFVRSGGLWSLEERLTAFEPSPGKRFGTAVALKDELMLIGRPRGTLQEPGQVYVFEHTGSAWTFRGTIDSPEGAWFGEAIAYDGRTAVIGAPASATAYAYARSGTTWSLEATWDNHNWEFGEVVAVSGDRALVGWPDPSNARAYRRTGTTWSSGAVLDELSTNLGAGVAISGELLLVGATENGVAGLGRAQVYRDFEYTSVDEDEQHFGSPQAENQFFGHRIDVDGDTLVVTAPGLLPGFVPSSPEHWIFVFVRQGETWVQQAVFGTSDGVRAGYSAAISGDTLVVGTTLDDHGSGAFAGSAYVFVRDGTTWSEQAKLIAPDHDGGDQFGYSVSISGNTVVVGAPEEWNTNGARAGSVYVYDRFGTTWAFTRKLRVSDGALFDHFGRSVDLDGDVLVSGANEADTGAPDSGAAYVFVREAGVWTETAKLVPSQPANDGQFGSTIALHGDHVVVGAPTEDGGTVYAFARNGTAWEQIQRIPGGQSFGRPGFGYALDVDENRLAIGRPNSSDGRAYLYAFSGASWDLVHELAPSDDPIFAQFGQSVALADATAFVGLHRHREVVAYSGAVYAFDLPEDVFPSFCDATDGALAACPCANPGLADTGCDIQQGTGGIRLAVTARATAPQNRATLSGTGFPPTTAPGVTVIRGTGIDSASPVVFGDGLRCISVPIVRVGATLAGGGVSLQTIGHGAAAGSGSFTYQLWVRNVPVMFCDPTAAFNLSNGRTIGW